MSTFGVIDFALDFRSGTPLKMIWNVGFFIFDSHPDRPFPLDGLPVDSGSETAVDLAVGRAGQGCITEVVRARGNPKRPSRKPPGRDEALGLPFPPPPKYPVGLGRGVISNPPKAVREAVCWDVVSSDSELVSSDEELVSSDRELVSSD
jgi:hypothetical protein